MWFDRLFINKTDWSDNKFLESYFSKRKMTRIDPACWKSHIISFLNDLYLNDVCSTNCNKSQLAIILMLPHPKRTELLFEDYFNETSFDSYRQDNSEELNIANINTSQYRMFFSRIQNLLASNSIEDKNFTALRAVLGVVALVCLRSVGKSINTIRNFFLKEFKSTMYSLYPDQDRIKEIPLPSSKFFNGLPLRCDKQSFEISHILICLVGMYTSEKTKYPQANNAIIDILNCCILQAVRLNGLGVISLLEKVSNIYQVDVHTIIKLIYSPTLPDSEEPQDKEENKNDLNLKKFLEQLKDLKIGGCEITVVNEFYCKYMANDSLEISWPWSRLIDDSYFYKCTIQNNIRSVTLAAIVSLNEPGIWNMPALKDKAQIWKARATKEAIKFDKLFRQD